MAGLRGLSNGETTKALKRPAAGSAMAARALGPASALLLLALAGCLGAPPPSGPPEPLAAPPAAASRTVAHDATGALVDLGAALDAIGAPAREAPRWTTRLLGTPGPEPTLGITSSGAVFLQALDTTMRSVDGGRTWEAVYDFGVDGAPVDPLGTNDPVLWVDPLTDRVFVDHMFPALACSSRVWSDDDGATWTHKPMTCGLPVQDHQKLATGPYAGAAPPTAALYPNVVYYCYNKFASTNCAVSFDGGLTHPLDVPVAIDARDGCAGVNGHPAAAPDGTVYVPLTHRSFTYAGSTGQPVDCGAPYVAVSEDNGRTWRVSRGPDAFGGEGLDADITVTPDGTAYMLYQGVDHLQYLARSRDRFATWEGPWTVTPPDVASTVFSAIASGDDGRIALAYLGNRDTKEAPSDAPAETRWHLFVATSLDADGERPTFVTQQATPDDDPVQIGCVWLFGGASECRNLLDFIDLHASPEGRPYVAFADGCTEACAGRADATDADSRASEAAVAYLERGPSLLAGHGWLAPPGASARAAGLPAPSGQAVRMPATQG